MKKALSLLAALLVGSFVLLAQDKTVTGKLTDEKSGQPLSGVSVTVKGTTVGTQTGADGTFRLSVPATAKTLVFSFVNYETVEAAIGNKSLFNISLTAADKDLQEVVIVGYQQLKKRDQGGAIASIRGKEIANLPNVSVDRALQGRAAGVLVQANNGIPGGGINVRVRGTGSYLSGNQPLFIVDGVQINTRDDAAFTQANPLAFLNPNDIESIDVLKDAASAAIYGSQAANGVVIITTKKGKSGKTKVTANIFAGVAQPIKYFDVLNVNEYLNMRAEADFNRYAPQYISNFGYTFLDSRRWVLGELSRITGVPYSSSNPIPQTRFFSQAQVDSLQATLKNTDWQRAALRKGRIQNFDMSMSGGNDKTTFYVGGSYSYQSTIINKVDFARYTLTSDLSSKLSNKLTVSLKTNLSTFEQQIPFAVSGAFLGSPAFSSPLIVPANPIYNADGSYFGLPPTGALAGILNQNIIANNEFNSGFQRTNQMIGQGSLDYKINNWLSFRSYYSLDYRLVQENRYRDPRTQDGFGVRGRGELQSNWNTNFLTTQTLNFNRSFGKNRIDGVAGYEYRRDIQEAISATGIGFPSFQFVTVNAAATPEAVGQFWTGYKRNSIFGRVNYSYDGRYILSATARRDGSSRFGNNFPFGTFGGVTGTWNIDRESFMAKTSDWLSSLRLRASYGVTGNDQIGNFPSLSLFGAGVQYNGFAGISYSQLGNPNIRWEKNQTINLGLDYGLFQNRVTGTLDLYRRRTDGMLLPRQVPWLSGQNDFIDNVGVLDNKGIEVGLNVEIIRPKLPNGFRWNANFNFAFNYSNVVSLYGGFQFLPGDPELRVGRSLNSIFTNIYAGVNPATGRPMWLDTLGHITYTPQARDRYYIGDREPDYWGGLTNTISYKGFTLDVLFTYEYGRWATDGQANFMLENGNRTFNTLRFAYENRWTKPGQITSYPRPFDAGSEQGGINHMSGSSRIWRRADFIRMRDVRLSYSLSQNLLRKAKLTNMTLYVQGQNLFTYSDYWGYDPEFVGTSTGIIPQTKNINAGITLGL